MVTASDDKTAIVWDAATGRQFAVLRGMGCYVLDAEFSPDGSKVVTLAEDNTAVIWDAATGDQLIKLERPDGSADGGRVTSYEYMVKYEASPISQDRVQFSPDGSLVMGNFAGQAVIWDAASGEVRWILPDVRTAQFNTDGSHVLTASADCSSVIWDVASGKETARLQGSFDPSDSTYEAIYSPDGSRILAISSLNDATVFDAESGQVLFTIDGSERSETETVKYCPVAQFDPDRSKIITLSDDRTMKVWDYATGIELGHWSEPGMGILHAGFSPDGTTIVVECVDEATMGLYIDFFDATSYKSIQFVNMGQEAQAIGSQFSPDSQKLLTTNDINSIMIWDEAVSQKFIKLAYGTEMFFASDIMYSRDGSTIFTTYGGETIEWDAATGKIRQFHPFMWNLGDSIDPDGDKIIDQKATIYDAKTGREPVRLAEKADNLGYIGFSPDGNRVVAVSDERTAIVWDAATGDELVRIESGFPINKARFSDDGSRIITEPHFGDHLYNRFDIWDANTGQLITAIVLPDDIVAIAFSPDNSTVVAVLWNGKAIVLDETTGNILFNLSGEHEISRCVKYSSDGSRIVTGSDDGNAAIWDAATGKEILDLIGHDSGIMEAAFNSDGSLILTVYDDYTTSIWSAEDGTELEQLQGINAEFSPDSQNVATSLRDGSIIIWPINQFDDIMHDAKNLIKDREFTQEEKEQYFLEQ